MPPMAAKKIAGAAVSSPPSAVTGKDTAILQQKEVVEKEKKVEKRDAKAAKTKAEGIFKITSFFTKRPATTDITNSAAPASPVQAACKEGTTLVRRNEECILLDSDCEGTPGDGSNTPPTASKRADEKKEGGVRGQDDRSARGLDGSAASVALITVQPTAPKQAGMGAVKGADGNTKAEGKKKAGRPAKADIKDIKAKDEVAKGRQGTLSFQPCEPRQGTLDLACMAGAGSIKAGFSSVPLKPKKDRPPHPTGTSIHHSSQFLTTLQFCNSFSEPLEIEPISKEDFDRALASFPDDVLSQMHLGLLYTILMNSKETKDEVNFLDVDTWPEILRQHLEDSRGKEGARSRELALLAADYPSLTKEQRLDIFEILVDDCLSTESIKTFIDGSLDKLDEIRLYRLTLILMNTKNSREEQMDMFADKYKRIEGEPVASINPQAGEMMAFVSVEEPVLEDLSDGKTTRQRALDRQRDEEAREKKLAEEKRLREEKRLADEAARKKAIKDRKDRAEQRILDLIKVNAQIRAPQVHAATSTYVVVDCLDQGQRRVIFADSSTELIITAPCSNATDAKTSTAVMGSVLMQTELGDDEKKEGVVLPTMSELRSPFRGQPEWRLLAAAGSDVESLLQHYSPVHCEDKGELQRRLREILPPVQVADSAPAHDTVFAVTDEPTEALGDVSGESHSKEMQGSQDETLPYSEPSRNGEAAVTETIRGEGSEVAESQDVPALLLRRLKDLVLDLDDCIPEDMFTNFQAYIKMRQEWRETVENATTVEDFKAPLVLFEDAMKHAKMKPGWAASADMGNHRAQWLKDVGSAQTLSQTLYHVKVLTWFIGRRQKARSSLKIASIFTGEMRLTRARAGIVKPSLAAKEAEEHVELSSNDDEDMEVEEDEWDQAGSEDETTRSSTRGSRLRSRTRNTRKTSQSSQRTTRRSTRVTRSQKRVRESGSESEEDIASDASDSSMNVKASRPVTRNTRQRLRRGADDVSE